MSSADDAPESSALAPQVHPELAESPVAPTEVAPAVVVDGPRKPPGRPGPRMRPFTLKVNGIQLPTVVEAEDAAVADDQLVIGIRVGMSARAYLLGAFEVEELKFPISRSGIGMIDDDDARVLSRHVVNDVIGDQPITVTHCELQKCTRVLTSSGRDTALEVGVGGWDDGLLLTIDGQHVPQRAVKMPLEDVPYEVTTWKEWREEHPQTDVYVGG